jgi:hypothetical protein
MKPINNLFLFVCLLLVLTANGCTTYSRESFIKSHSVEQFMRDRPAAGNRLREHPQLEQWLLTQWNKPVEGFRIYWSDDQPTASPTAEHIPQHKYRLIMIRVSNKLAPADQLLALSYETCNAQGLSSFDAACDQAAAGKITRGDFINKIDQLEYAAVLQVKECFPKLFPLSSNEVAATTLYRKLLEVPVGFHEYQAWSIRTHSQNYLHAQDLYGQDYDRLAKVRSNP